MKAKDVYKSLGEDYEEVYSRLEEDAWITKYLKQFLKGNYQEDIIVNIDQKNWNEAFKASHSLKGLSLNLGLSRLANESSELCEALRHGEPTIEIGGLVDSTIEEYNRVVGAISQLD